MSIFKGHSPLKFALALIFATIICASSAPFILLARYNYLYIGRSISDMNFSVYKIYKPIHGSNIVCYLSGNRNDECLWDNDDDMLDHYNIGLGFRVVYLVKYDQGTVKKIYISLMPPDLAI